MLYSSTIHNNSKTYKFLTYSCCTTTTTPTLAKYFKHRGNVELQINNSKICFAVYTEPRKDSQTVGPFAAAITTTTTTIANN